MSTSLTIRPAARHDVAAIVTLLNELYHEEGHAVEVNEASLLRVLFELNRDVQLQALLTCDGDAVVGVVLFYAGYDVLSASDGYHLADMVVTRSHRRLGIGAALFKALAAQTLAQQKEWISLTALRTNEAAKHFYTSLGMTNVDVNFYAIGKKALSRL